MMKSIAVIGIVALMLSGCASSTGWRFEIGVSPVKQLDNRAGLTQEDDREERRK